MHTWYLIVILIIILGSVVWFLTFQQTLPNLPTNGFPADNTSPDSTPFGVNFFNERGCEGSTCIDFAVTCGPVNKSGSLTLTDPVSPKGTVFLVTSGDGTKPYHTVSSEMSETVNYLAENNYRVVEIFWSKEEHGVISYPTPVGAVNLFCVPSAVFRAFDDEYGIGGPLCAQGNSGGSMQLSYGLTFYGLDDFFDTVILSGGPPTSSFTEGCNGVARNPTIGFPPDLNIGVSFVDQVSGAGVNAERDDLYCRNAWKGEIDIYDFPEIAEKFDAESLVVNKGKSRNPDGEYDYPNTNVFFVESADDETNAGYIGKLYYDLVTARKKTFTEISGAAYPRGGHNVPSTREGAAEIRNLLIENCI